MPAAAPAQPAATATAAVLLGDGGRVYAVGPGNEVLGPLECLLMLLGVAVLLAAE